MKITPTTEERVWAVLSHLSALALGMGILLPIIGWSEQRHKSRYASFQCLQALGYQSLGYTVWMLFYLVMLILFMIVFVFVMASVGNGDRTQIVTGTATLMFVVFGLFGVYLLFPVVAAVACALGRDFRYPIMGDRLAGYLGYEMSSEAEGAALHEQHEERWVAAMGHFSVIIPLWGLLAPVTSWILQGKHNAFLRFQSIQTTVFQAAVNIFYVGAGFLYFFGIIALFAMTGLEGDPNGNSPMSMAGIMIFFISLLVIAVIMLIVPVFHILGQWAGYRVLKGYDYQYPLIGRWIEQRITHKIPLTAEDGHLTQKGNT